MYTVAKYTKHKSVYNIIIDSGFQIILISYHILFKDQLQNKQKNLIFSMIVLIILRLIGNILTK